MLSRNHFFSQSGKITCETATFPIHRFGLLDPASSNNAISKYIEALFLLCRRKGKTDDTIYPSQHKTEYRLIQMVRPPAYYYRG